MELRIISCSGAVEHTIVSQEGLVNQTVLGTRINLKEYVCLKDKLKRITSAAYNLKIRPSFSLFRIINSRGYPRTKQAIISPNAMYATVSQ